MRYRLMATYHGAPYEAGIGPSDGDVVLFAACPPPEELGFEPATGHWRKQLRIDDVQALWESRPTGTYRAQRCMVLDDLGDRLHIAYLGHDSFQAQELGYWQVDRGVFELVTQRDEVTDVTEERSDYPGHHPAGYGPVSAGAGYGPVSAGPATADYGPLSADYGPVTTDFGVISPGGRAPAPILPGGSTALSRPDFAVIPPAREAPLPLEAAAMRAASAAGHPGPAERRPALAMPPAATGRLAAPAVLAASATPETTVAQEPPVTLGSSATLGSSVMRASMASPRRRRSARARMATQGIFTELAGQAAIPAAAYAVGEEVDGALCLIETTAGYEVFSAAGGARHEVRFFEDEESAYFYLFGVLAAEAVRTGLLIPHR